MPISEVLPIVGGDTGSDLIDIFTKYTSSDINDPAQMIGALKAFLAVKDVPINQISFDGDLGPSYVTATPDQIKKAVDEFLNGKDTPGPTGGENATKPDDGSSGGSGGSKDKKKSGEDPTDGANLIPTSDVLDPETGINKFDAFGKTSSRRLAVPDLGADRGRAGLRVQRGLAAVRHQGRGRQEAACLQARDRVHGARPAARVLRGPGHDLVGPADPPRQPRHPARSTAATSTSTTTATGSG